MPPAIGDPFLFIQNGAVTTILTNRLERDASRACAAGSRCATLTNYPYELAP